MESPDKNQDSQSAPISPERAVVRSGPDEIADCWNQIGVTGDGSCKELAKVVHCRNCSIYSSSGALLLNRPLPENYRRDWTEHFTHEKTRAAQAKHSVVLFGIGTECLALPTRAFHEITELRKIHSLPHRRNTALLGLINVRGELLLCVSLARLLNIASADEYAHYRSPVNRLVVAEWQGSFFTFPVDEIYGIHRFDTSELKPVPATVSQANSSFTSGMLSWKDRRVGCLDAELLFSTLNRSLS